MDALETLVRSTDSGAVASAARSYGVEYLVVTQRLLLIYGVTQQQLEARPWFERAFFAHGGSGESVAVYRIKNAAREISQRTTS
jgi:hypothetical protein